MGYSQRSQHVGHDKLKELLEHPNIKMPLPENYSNAIAFACACIGELISPLQEIGEDNDIDCKDLKNAILDFKSDIINWWASRK